MLRDTGEMERQKKLDLNDVNQLLKGSVVGRAKHVRRRMELERKHQSKRLRRLDGEAGRALRAEAGG